MILSNIFKKYSKQEIKEFFLNNLLIFFGAILLAFGTAIFIKKLQIVSGGLSGIAIIIQSFFPNIDIVDICIVIGEVIMWILGAITFGKRFIIRTTFASIIYSIFIFVFMRVPKFIEIANEIAGTGQTGDIILCALFYGVFCGAGVAIPFIGGGSTGGVDVLIWVLTKKTNIKESIWSFIIDGIIILLSMFLIKDNIVNSLCGIISAFLAAIMIEFIYIKNQSSYCVDIISSHYEEISKYAQESLLRGATLIPVKGGYKGEDRILLRVVIEKRQYDKLRGFITKVDKKAFVTYTPTVAVYGEGFKNHY